LISILIACGLIYYSNFFKVLYEHEKIDNFYFIISIISYASSFSIMLFLSIYLPYFKNINEDKWDELYPNMIPLATILGLLGMISLITSIWNVWRWYSIPLVLLIKWGFIMTAHFAPGGVLGSIICILIIIAALISGYYIEHEGYLH
jgi:hypothetical protein